MNVREEREAEEIPLAPAGERNGRRLRDPLGRRLLAGLLAVNLLAAGLATLVELALDYRRAVEQLRIDLDTLQRSADRRLVQALASGDPDAIQRQLGELLQLPPVFYVQLVAGDGSHFEAGRPVTPPRDSLQRTFKLQRGAPGQPPELLASMLLEASTSAIKSRLFDRFLVKLLLQLGIMLSLSLFFLPFFRKLVVRHLDVVAAQMRRSTVLNLREPLQLDRYYADDELGELVKSFNLLRRNLLHEIEIRNQHDCSLAAENSLQQQVLNALPQLLFYFTVEGTLAWMNAAGECCCGQPLPQARGRRLAELLPAVKGSGESSVEMLFLQARSAVAPLRRKVLVAAADGVQEREATAIAVGEPGGTTAGVLLVLS